MSLRTLAPLLVFIAACGGSVDSVPTSGTQTKTITEPPATTGTSQGPARPAVTRLTWASEASGCGDIFVHVADSTDTMFLIITGQRAELGLDQAGASTTIDLATEQTGRVSVGLDAYPRKGGAEHYCNDALSAEVPKRSEQWKSIAGKVTFELGNVDRPDSFEITLKLDGVVLQKPDGTTEAIPSATYTKVHVGWLAG